MIEKYRLKYQDVLLEELGEVVDVGGIPVVYGSGGKTEILCEKYPEMIVYDSREILEPRNLGGLYVLRDGDLHYIDGILVEAMLTGLLLCFKRIDANIGLLQYLRPVIRDRAITTTNGCTIKAHADFRLAFTALDLFCFKNVTFIGPVGFTYASIMESFGDMRLSVENALGYVKTFKKEKCQAGRGLSCAEICLKEVFSCSCSENGLVCGDHYRMFCGLKSFLLLLKEKGAIDSTNYNRCILYQGLVNYILKHDSERLLGHLHAAQQPLVFPNLNFAKTKAVESTLRGLIGNIQCKQPTLLVGETGAGKTALLQYLCDNSFHFFGMKTELKIINMSSDFDGTLLVGGYQSIDFNAKIKDLYSLAGIEMPALTNRKTLIQHLIAHCERQETINGPNKHIISNLMKVKLDAQAYLKILGQKLAFCFKEGILVKAMREGTWILLDEVNLAPEETLDLLEALLSKKQFLAYESGAKDNFIVHPNFMVFACMNPFGDYGKKHYNTSVFNTLTFYDFSASLDCIKAVIRSISRNLLSGVDAMAEFYYELRKAVCSKKYTNVVEPLITGRTLCRAIDLAVKLESQGHLSSVYSAFSLLFLTQLDLNSRSQALALYKKYLRSFPVKPSMFVNTSSDNRWCGNFVLTPKVCIYLNDVELAVQAGLPVLLQGDTATGKTSLVTALARKHGTRVIRINNHEHTDASEYIGNYTTSQDGVIFKEGPLVLALRTGAWLILDELNLAPSDVLEVLNRLLDDNREIYVPELDEVVKPHPKFRLFGTQNIRYGGRQGLAKSFRNRFVEIFFYEKDNLELREIIEKRCKLPSGFVKLMMGVYGALQGERTLNSLITLRDLFKWADRGPRSYFEVYEIGLDILMARQRKVVDRERVREVMNEVFGDRMRLDKKDYSEIYQRRYLEPGADVGEYNSGFIFNNLSYNELIRLVPDMILTVSYLKLIDLIYKAWLCNEPVLIVGETGIGKTRFCKVVASLFGVKFKSINMHSEIESSDFIGQSVMVDGSILWRNGPLVDAMVDGEALLIDEINLAEDAVLERMNSVLEDKRNLYVTEIGKEFQANDRFKMVATMNPGGDYGKREISPALRNRFTEIYFQLEDEEYLEVFDRMIEKIEVPVEDAGYFKGMVRNIRKGMSIRKIELSITHISNIYFNNRKYNDGDELTGLCLVEPILSPVDIWNDVLGLLGYASASTYEYFEDSYKFGVAPYFLRKNVAVATATLGFCFDLLTVRVNLQKLARGLFLGKSMLLSGEPGVGKTSILQMIAKILGIPIIRINLSEQTEMGDLVGTYIPVSQTISFVESEMIVYAKKGYWIILDEINLCTQSVIEGLNSMLDHRRTIRVDNVDVPVNPNTRIFGTMNPVTSLNGRKQLPKSFMDRFIVVEMSSYSSSDIRSIIASCYGESCVYSSSLSLRGNIKFNELENIRRGYGDSNRVNDINIDNDINRVNDVNRVNDINRVNDKRNSIKNNEYNIDNTFRIGNLTVPYNNTLDESYVIIHSQLPQLEEVICCLKAVIPVILTGNIGRMPMLRFLARLLGMDLTVVDCHKETDTYDLLGQYQKADTGDLLFVWKNSSIVDALSSKSLIVINMPELVDKSVFDRLSSLFESGRTLSVYERGTEANIPVNPDCRFVLCCDNPSLLSPALLDRCHLVSLSSNLTYIDLYKMFHSFPGLSELSSETTGENFPKRLKLRQDNGRFRELNGTNEHVVMLDLDLAIKRLAVYGTIPKILSRNLPIYNVLVESRINKLFEVELKVEVPYDKATLERYKHMEKLSSSLGRSYRERVDNLKNRSNIITLIKNLEYTDGSTYEYPCLEAPSSLKEYKINFIRNLKSRTLSEWVDIGYFVDNIVEVGNIEDIAFESVLFDEDPLILVKKELENEMAARENSSLVEIALVAKQLYKYGTQGDKLKSCIEEHDAMISRYSEDIAKINRRLGRNYLTFRKTLESVSFCEYFRSLELRLFLEEFRDVFDCHLLELFRKRHECNKCVRRIDKHDTYGLTLELFRNGRYTKCTKYEYSRFVYEACMGNSIGAGRLVLEAICFNEVLDEDDINAFDWHTIKLQGSGSADGNFTEEEIDECLRCLVPAKTTVRAIETRVERITLGKDFYPCELISELSLFSTPEQLIEKLQQHQTEMESKIIIEEGLNFNSSTLESNLDFIKNLYKHESSLVLDRNYRYFIYFLFNTVGPASMESFFLGCSMYEYIDRMYFACKYLDYSYTNMLYNIILQYKAFELEDIYVKKTKECKNKLFKEPRLFDSTIRTYVDRFMYIPVTSLLKIRFEQPNCQNQHSWLGPSVLLKKYSTGEQACECALWNILSKEFVRTEINNDLAGVTALTKDELISCFYNRVISYSLRFSYFEICLSKVFNTVIEAINRKYFDEVDLHTLCVLFRYAVDYTFPPFLYFIYKFADNTKADVEEGVALKSGQGMNNLEGDVQEEDICDDVDNNEAEEKDDEAVDMENDGEMQSISNESEGDSGVDDENGSEGDKEEDDKEERGITDEIDGTKDGVEEPTMEEEEKAGMEEDLELSDNSTASIETTESEAAASEPEDEEEGAANCDDENSANCDDENSANCDDEDSLVSYKWTEAALNREQTCTNADGYNRRVGGDNVEEKDALEEGDGEEMIEGEGETGKGVAIQNRVEFPRIASECAELVELLRVILASNKNSKYKGDYKTGRKLNMKRIIPYIASDYRKDKIWMKRKRSEKKEYVIRIFIDNSRSMYDQELVNMLSVVYSKLSLAFSLLNIPVLLFKFGQVLQECTIDMLTFSDETTSVEWVDEYSDGINIILTDGVFQSGCSYKDNFLVIIIDKKNIRKMSKVSVVERQVFVETYLSTFALRYCILKDIGDLEQVFVEALGELIKGLI